MQEELRLIKNGYICEEEKRLLSLQNIKIEHLQALLKFYDSILLNSSSYTEKIENQNIFRKMSVIIVKKVNNINILEAMIEEVKKSFIYRDYNYGIESNFKFLEDLLQVEKNNILSS